MYRGLLSLLVLIVISVSLPLVTPCYAQNSGIIGCVKDITTVPYDNEDGELNEPCTEDGDHEYPCFWYDIPNCPDGECEWKFCFATDEEFACQVERLRPVSTQPVTYPCDSSQQNPITLTTTCYKVSGETIVQYCGNNGHQDCFNNQVICGDFVIWFKGKLKEAWDTGGSFQKEKTVYCDGC